MSVVAEEATSVTATVDFVGIVGEGCRFAGQNIAISSGACDFVFKATGAVEIKTDTNVTGECTHTMQPIEFEFPIVNCKAEIGEQNLPAGSVAYTNIKPKSGMEEITLSTPGAHGTGIEGIQVNATGAGCPFGTGNFGTFTTGNTILTGERGGAMVNLKWDVT